MEGFAIRYVPVQRAHFAIFPAIQAARYLPGWSVARTCIVVLMGPVCHHVGHACSNRSGRTVIKNAIMVMNGKGGVLKTTLTAQILGLAAASGWRVLGVDLDQQANLARDLGYARRSDGGAGLLEAVVHGKPVLPIAGVRENLDIIAGGPELVKLSRHLDLERASDPLAGFDHIERAVRGVAGPYELVVFDSPPGGEVIHLEAMTTCRAVVIPTQPDQGSIDGLATVFRRLTEVRGGPNPLLEVLGVALGPVPSQSTRLRSDTLEKLEDLGNGKIHVFDSVIRSSQKIAVECREAGLLVHEYEQQAAEAKATAPKWFQLSAAERKQRKSYSTAAGGLARDYEALVQEILQRFSEVRSA